jgi:eukaryotic-like serine/threonine-protein kinase
MNGKVDKAGSSAERGAPLLGSEQEVTTRLGRGRRLGRYQLLELIRRGKRTELYRAEATGREEVPTLYAVKITRAELDSSPDAARDLSCETHLLSQLDHPNVVRLEDHGNVAGAIYIALEYLDGRSLSQLLQALSAARSWMPADVATHVAREMALGLAHVHGVSIGSIAPAELVHRDVRPGHVMLLRTGAVKLIDFSAARCADRRAGRQMTELDLRERTVAYLSPEQLRGQVVDRRADLFSLGVILWEMLAQRRLFARETPQEAASAVVLAAIPALETLRSDLSPRLTSVVAKALARDPRQRYQSAEEMAADLGRCMPARELLTRGVAVLVEAIMDRGDSGLLPVPPRAAPAVAPSSFFPPGTTRPQPLPPIRPVERTDVSWLRGHPVRAVLDRLPMNGKRLLRAGALTLLGFAAGALWQRGRSDDAEARRAPSAVVTTRSPGLTFEPIRHRLIPSRKVPSRKVPSSKAAAHRRRPSAARTR